MTEDFNSYIKRKRDNHCHGNHVEMQALSEMYNRSVEVYQCSIGKSYSGRHVLYVTFQGSKLGRNIFRLHLPSGYDLRVNYSYNFATTTQGAVTRATILVTASSPAFNFPLPGTNDLVQNLHNWQKTYRTGLKNPFCTVHVWHCR